MLDELVLLDIYPAREKPIEGVDSQMLLNKVTIENKMVSSKAGLVDCLMGKDFDVLLMVGAGDLDLLIPDVEKALRNKLKL